MFRKLRVQFVSVFMVIMIVFAAALTAVIYFQQKNELEYDCMVYLLNVNNFDNFNGHLPGEEEGYPPYFVISIDHTTDSATVIRGNYFLESRGVTPDELIAQLVGHQEETGILEEYQVRYYNGVRSENSHQIAFMDISYIGNELHQVVSRILLFAVPSLVLMFFVALALSGWFVRPAKSALSEQRRFISFASHELKTPVSIVRANIDLLERTDETANADNTFCYDNIRYECDRMRSLVEAMVWIALPEKTAEPSQFSVTELLQEELLRFEVRAFEAGLTLETDVKEGLSVTCDIVQFRTVLDILLDNALKYTDIGGTVAVTAERDNRHLRLVVANTGTEIPREDRENIFKPFYQRDQAKEGAGIGLSIAREIIGALRGHLRVEYENGFNRFVVEL